MLDQSVQFSHSVVSDSLQPRGLQHTRPPCPSPTPRVYSDSCLSSRWYHPTISFSVVPFSSHLQSFPASRSLQMSQLFTKVLEFQLQHQSFQWLFGTPKGRTGWISLQPKGLSRVFSNTTIPKHQFFSAQLSLWRRKWQPTPGFLPRESRGQRSLVGCCPQGRTGSDMTEAT